MKKVQNMILLLGLFLFQKEALKSKSHDSSGLASMSSDLAAILTNDVH